MFTRLLAAIILTACGFQAGLAQEGRLVRAVYPVADLVTPIVHHSAFAEARPVDASKPDELADALVQRIIKSIAMKSWETSGGNGSIRYLPSGKALVIHQSAGVHEEVTKLLASMRRASAPNVALEVRFVEVSADTSNKIQDVLKDSAKKTGEVATVDDIGLKALLEMAQADKQGAIRQAPTLTLANGQIAGVNARSQQVGIRFDGSGIVSPDRRIVRLWLDVEDAIAANRVLRTSDTFDVPTDRTLIWRVGEVGGTHVFVAARPRVVVEVEERLFLGEIPPLPRR